MKESAFSRHEAIANVTIKQYWTSMRRTTPKSPSRRRRTPFHSRLSSTAGNLPGKREAEGDIKKTRMGLPSG